ncbi:MAG: phosphotransferase family protein [Pseudomonadales bacterium]
MNQPADQPLASGEVVAVKPQHSFDHGRLDAYLREHVPGYRGPMTVSQFEGGQSNPTFFVHTPARAYVLRRKPPGALVKSAHAVDREYRVLKALNHTTVPVPEALALCEDPDVIGTTFFVMEHVPGRVLANAALPELAAEQRAALVFDYIDTLALLHAVDYQSLGLDDFGRAGNYFERQISRWGRQYRETETVAIPQMHRLLAWLESSVPAQQITSIVHGDYQFGNVLTHPTEPKVAAVLDWELSTIGDPLADFTYFTGPWHAPAGERSLANLNLDALGIPSYQAVLERYCTQLDRDDIGDERFYRAFHAFRSGAILQGIIRRALQGNNAGAMALTFTADNVRALAERGLDYIDS